MRQLFLICILLSITGNAFYACKDAPKKVIKTAPITFKKEGELLIYSSGTDSLLTRLDIEIADSDYETQTGLMYRDAMAAEQGMFFIFGEEAMHSFYMKNTKIPLDLIFIKSDNKVGHIVANAQPLNEAGLSSRVPVHYVLEVNAGMTEQWGIQLGDSIAYTRR